MNSSNAYTVLVLGMHRSGTSALAGLLSHLGLDAGPSLSSSDEHVNPKGFWEHRDIVAIHDKLLEAIGSSWDDERPLPDGWWERVPQHRQALVRIVRRDFSKSLSWVVKDPRLCRLLPLWRDILIELNVQPLVVMAIRHPLEVAGSLQQRDNFLREKSYLLWLRHLIDMEHGSRGLPRVLVPYEQLLDDWQGMTERIAQSLSLSLPVDGSKKALIEDFLEPSLRHHRAMQEEPHDDELAMLSCSIYRSLLSMSLDSLDQILGKADEKISSHVVAVAPWASKVRSLEKEIAWLAHQNANLTTEIKRVKSTVSWQVTRPLRLVANLPGCLRKAMNRLR